MDFPVGLAVVVLLAIPATIAVLLGIAAFRGETPLVFRCARCGHEFRRKPWKPLAACCPSCRARNWSA